MYLGKIVCCFSLFITSLYSSQVIDIAVIGAGVNGTYTSWKLSSLKGQDGNPLHIDLFEATDRIGGRLYTLFFPEMKHVPVELGGMRFKGNHKYVRKLAEELGLTVVPFSSEATDNFYYLRGVRLRQHELIEPSKLPYKLAENEKGKTGSEILLNAVSQIIPNIRSLTTDEWAQKRATFTYEGKLLKDLSWINFISSQISPEAFQYLVDIGEISQIGDVSLLSKVDLMVSEPNNETLKIAEGYQLIPLRLAEKFRQSGGSIHLNHRLVQILSSKNPEEGYELIFDNGTGKEKHYFARKVILTISPTALLHLIPQTPLANDSKLQTNLNSVSPNELTKLFFAYHSPWWRSLKLNDGYSITSMPIRSCYYFPSEEDTQNGNRNSLLLASYQGAFTPLWRSLNAFKIQTNKAAQDIPSDVTAGKNTIGQALHQLKILHGLTDIPDPYAAAFQDWGKPPYYAAYYFWNVGTDSHQVDLEVRKPNDREEIYIFTSDFCEDQGWVECALRVADRLINQYLQMYLSNKKINETADF